MIDSDDPKTLQQAILYWSDPHRCDDYMRKIRWPTGVVRCLHCDSTKCNWMAARRKYQCNGCRKQFSLTVGTIYEDSKIKLSQWFLATWLLAGCRNGVSSYEIARHCGVTQKTAWFMDQRIRCAMQLAGIGDKFDGPAEADTTYVGGKDSANVSPIDFSRRKVTPDLWASNKGLPVTDAPKKPPGWNDFNAAAKAIVSVPKAAVDAKLAKDKAARIAKRGKEKK